MKSLGILIAGVALGWGIGRLPQQDGGTKENGRQLPAAVKNETVSRHGGSLKDKPHINPATLLDGDIASFMTGLAEEELDAGSVQALAIRWGKLDPKAAAPFILNRPELADAFRYWILERLAEVDLPAAKAATAGLEEAVRMESERIILAFAVERDVRAALAYARELKNNEAEACALCAMAETDPMAAAAELTPGREDQKPVMEVIAASMLGGERKKYDAWATGLKDPAQRAVARRVALEKDAGADPHAAALEMSAWLAGDREASAHVDDLPADLAVRWENAGAQPAEVAAWALSLPEGAARDSAVSETGRMWVVRDRVAAENWLSTLPHGAGRDHAVSHLVERIRWEAAAESFKWARTIGSPLMRGDALSKTVLSWTGTDTDAAEKALEALPANDRAYVRDTLKRGRAEGVYATESK